MLFSPGRICMGIPANVPEATGSRGPRVLGSLDARKEGGGVVTRRTILVLAGILLIQSVIVALVFTPLAP